MAGDGAADLDPLAVGQRELGRPARRLRLQPQLRQDRGHLVARSRPGGRHCEAATRMFSATVMLSNSRTFWNVRHMPARRRRWVGVAVQSVPK